MKRSDSMNEIGVFVNEQNNTSSFEDAKYIRIFEQKGEWKIKKEILINRTSNEKGLNGIREEYKNLVKQMDECKIIVVTKAFGIPYSVFYMEDFSVWELEGNPMEYLDEILKRERDQEETEAKEVGVGKKINEGYYLIDLQELELTNPEMSSKKAIIPYLQREEVEIIEVRCCHVPPWLINKKENNEIKLKVNEIGRNDYKVMIEKK
jgi:Fe-only nitrogenase accessory protein AnfO